MEELSPGFFLVAFMNQPTELVLFLIWKMRGTSPPLRACRAFLYVDVVTGLD
jgi:hypothetical protein